MRATMKHLAENLHAKIRKRHADVKRANHMTEDTHEHSQETPITLRSKLAWMTIALMICVIVAAALKEHPGYMRAEYDIVKTGANPYMGWATTTGDTYLLLVHTSWREIQPDPPGDSLLFDRSNGYVWEDADYMVDQELRPNQRIVLEFSSLAEEDMPEWLLEQLGEIDDEAEREQIIHERWESAVKRLARYLDDNESVAYIQLDRVPGNSVPVAYNDLQLLSPSGEGVWSGHMNGEDSWLTSASAGTVDAIFGNHLTYLIGEPDDTELAGQVGYAIGVRRGEWHITKNRNDRLFVNLDIYNAGVAPLYHEYKLQLSLQRAGKIWAVREQDVNLSSLMTNSLNVRGYIDVPYNVPVGKYTLCVAIVDPDTGAPAIHMTMDSGNDDLYYSLGEVNIK